MKNIVLRRPGAGIPPDHIEKILGKRINKNLKAGSLLKINHIKI